MNKTMKLSSSRFALAVAGGLVLSAASGHAQGVSATISNQQLGPSDWLYTITLTDTGTTDISSLWYAWTPDVSPFFYLPSGTISNISGDNSWTGSTVANSIQYIDNGNTDNGNGLTQGQSVNLMYEASFSPSQLAAAPHSGLSVAYEGAVDASSSTPDFTVVAAPEPSSLGLLATGLAGLAFAGRRLKKNRASGSV
jgi:hypothetical protein